MLKLSIARHLPWWLVVLLGAACVVVGGVLTARPFASLSVLAALTAAALLVSGTSELATAASSTRPWLSRFTGVVWIVAGLLAAAWPGLTIGALAIAIGIALAVGGVAKLAAALLGGADERFLLGLGGLTSVIVGLLALAWPGVTVLVLAVLFGVRTVLFGFGQIAVALKLRRARDEPWAPSWRWRAGAAARGDGRGAPPRPGRDGAQHRDPPRPAGSTRSVLRAALCAPRRPSRHAHPQRGRRRLPEGRHHVPGALLVDRLRRQAHRGERARPRAERQPARSRAAHRRLHARHRRRGQQLAPSLQPASQQPLFLEGGDALLAAGYVIAAPDYQGLGTPGPHPYLVGASEAANTLDSVRAARNLPQAHASRDYAVWGHSQGGHAALFTGEFAGVYAPELRLHGIAAGAPVPNLVDLFKVNVKTTVGKVLIAMALDSWQRVYHDASLSRIVTPAARPAVARIARHCLYGRKQVLASVLGALVLGLTFLSAPVWDTEPWRTIAEENTPSVGPVDVPMLVVQSGADTIVDPAVTRRYVDELCASARTVELRLYPGVGHVQTGHVAAPDVERWLAERFAGRPAPSTCG